MSGKKEEKTNRQMKTKPVFQQERGLSESNHGDQCLLPSLGFLSLGQPCRASGLRWSAALLWTVVFSNWTQEQNPTLATHKENLIDCSYLLCVPGNHAPFLSGEQRLDLISCLT